MLAGFAEPMPEGDEIGLEIRAACFSPQFENWLGYITPLFMHQPVKDRRL